VLEESRETIFKRWLEGYKGLIFKIVMSYTSTSPDEDDLFQNVLLQLWISIPNFNSQANETTWIYKVALNTALVWNRSQKSRRKSKALIFNCNDISDNKQSIHDSIQKRQIIDRVYNAIHKLPKIDSSIVLMYLDGFSYEQMSDVLGISTSNVGVRLNRAKKKLADLLEGLVDDV
jgi:RNA polymerase sigma-70 factor (ECF subfamily)